MTPARTPVARAALALAVLVQLVVLYAPAGPGAGPFPNSDKVVHVLVFLVPVAVATLVTGRPRVVAAVFVAHAVVSEVVQGTVLPMRSGDPLDALADVVGVGLGLAVALRIARRRGSGAAQG